MTGPRRHGVTATRAAARELRAEQRVAREGREFLDQKRMLLATEILRRLQRLEELHRELEPRLAQSEQALAGATARHGLEGLWVYPASPLDLEIELTREPYIGVDLVAARVQSQLAPEPPPAAQPSPEARLCRQAFAQLVPALVEIAALSSTLERLGEAYRQTNRRVRALERVLMPEIDGTLRAVEEQLDEQDQEEAIYARLPRTRKT